MSPDRRFELPDDLSAEEERATLNALERYFFEEDPRPHDWVLAGRMDATGYGALQVKRLTDAPWRVGRRVQFARRSLALPLYGRGDAR